MDPRDHWVLTPKGERWVLAAYRLAVTVAALGTFLLLLGLVGFVEGLP